MILLKVSLSCQLHQKIKHFGAEHHPPAEAFPLAAGLVWFSCTNEKQEDYRELCRGTEKKPGHRGYGEERNWSAGLILSSENWDRVPPIVNFQPLKEASFTLPSHEQSKDTVILCLPSHGPGLLKL